MFVSAIVRPVACKANALDILDETVLKEQKAASTLRLVFFTITAPSERFAKNGAIVCMIKSANVYDIATLQHDAKTVACSWVRSPFRFVGLLCGYSSMQAPMVHGTDRALDVMHQHH